MTIVERLARLETAADAQAGRLTRELDLSREIHVDLAISIGKLTRVVEKQDARIDKIEGLISRLLGGLAVLIIVAQVILPLILKAIGIPPDTEGSTMQTKRPPLGLPEGSVRALLALSLTAATIALAFLGRLEPREVVALAGIAIAFYFASRPK